MAAPANDLRFDLDLAERDVQGLSSADALAAFFASLGYRHTEVRGFGCRHRKMSFV